MKFLQECYENYEELDIDECEDYLELPFHNLTSDSLTYSSALQPILENSEMRSSINDQDFIEKLTHSWNILYLCYDTLLFFVNYLYKDFKFE